MILNTSKGIMPILNMIMIIIFGSFKRGKQPNMELLYIARTMTNGPTLIKIRA